MKSIKLFFPLLILPFLLSFSPAFGAGSYAVDFTTSPAANVIGPDTDLVHVALTVKDDRGNIVPGAYLKLRMHSPPGNPFLSTDIPWVENTHLLEYEGYVSNGILTFDYIFPIRGQYRVDVQAGVDASSLPLKTSLPLLIHENGIDVRNISILLTLLLGFGTAAGFVIRRGAGGKEPALAAAVIFLILSLPLFSFPVYADHCHRALNAVSAPPLEEQAAVDGMTLNFTMNPGAGKVGMLNDLTFSLKDAGGRPVPDTVFDVTLWHIEDDKPVFSGRLLGKEGSANLNFQFFDGAEHEVRVTARHAAGEVRLKRAVEVEAIHPPTVIKIKTMAYFLLVVFSGLALGFRLQGGIKLKSA